VDPHEACLEIRIAPGCEVIVSGLIEALKKEGVMLSEKEPLAAMDEE
jgi:hypothetical protein